MMATKALGESTHKRDAYTQTGTDIEQGHQYDMANDQPSPGAQSLSQMNLHELLRNKSADGRREGWLAQTIGRIGEDQATSITTTTTTTTTTTIAGNTTTRTSAVTRQGEAVMLQLQQDPRDVLIPDRIWDGRTLKHQGTSPVLHGLFSRTRTKSGPDQAFTLP
jgi:hypothetical protein